MKGFLLKKIIFCALSLTLMYSTVAQANMYQNALDNYNKALAEFVKYVEGIRLRIWTSYGYKTTTIHYEYTCPSEASLKSFNAYKSAKVRLENQALGSALGDGFIVGSVAAMCTKLWCVEPLETEALLAGAAATIGLIIYQNSRAGSVPYYDIYLDRYDNMFEQASVFTVGRIFIALGGAAAGYFCTHYTMDKIADQYNDLYYAPIAQ